MESGLTSPALNAPSPSTRFSNTNNGGNYKSTACTSSDVCELSNDADNSGPFPSSGPSSSHCDGGASLDEDKPAKKVSFQKHAKKGPRRDINTCNDPLDLVDPVNPVDPVNLADIERHAGPAIKSQNKLQSSVSAIKSVAAVEVKFTDRAAPGEGLEFYTPCDEFEELEEEHLDSHLYVDWMDVWLGNITEPGRAVMLKKAGNEFCDIDTDTLRWRNPVVQPITLMARPGRLGGYIDEAVVWRQLNYTANYRIRAWRDFLSRKAENAKTLFTQIEDYNKAGEQQMWSGDEYKKYDGPHVAIRANVVLRPATLEDMVGVTAIYDLEATTGTQASHREPVKTEFYQLLFQTCQQQQLPFIVAVAQEEEKIDMNLVPASQRELFQEFLEFRATREKAAKTDSIVGFAHTSVLDFGLVPGAGLADDLNLFSVKLQLYVHPDHRLKGIGTALLDRMVSFASTLSPRLPGYKWQYDGDNRVYADSAVDSARPVHRMYMTGQFPSSVDKSELEWRDKFLGKYGSFERAAKLKGHCRGRGGEFLDVILWETEVRPMNELVRNRGGIRQGVAGG